MKILCAYNLYYYGTENLNSSYYFFTETFLQMDHDVQTMDFKGLKKKGGARLVSKILLSYIFSYKPDILFVVPCRGEIPKKILKFIKNFTNTTVIAWNSDDDRRWDDYSKKYADAYDYMITTYENIYKKAKEQGYKNILLSQWACNPKRNRKLETEKKFDLSFIGVAYGDRMDYIKKLINEGFNVKFGGLEWEKYLDIKKTDFSQEDMLLITNQSKIAIVFSKGIDGKKQIKARVFETPAHGVCTFIEHFDGIEKYYKDNEDIVIFQNSTELIEKARYYLENEEEREKIAQTGRKKVLENYTYELRFEKLFDQINFNKKINIITKLFGKAVYKTMCIFF